LEEARGALVGMEGEVQNFDGINSGLPEVVSG